MSRSIRPMHRFPALMLTWMLGSVALAQPTTQPRHPAAASRPSEDVRNFTISPMAPPADALHNRLRVDAADEIDGDAATLYLQAFTLGQSDAQMEALQAVDEEASTDEAFAKLVAERVPWLTTEIPPMLETATLREQCDWGIPLRRERLGALLPYLNHVRTMSSLLAAKVRLALARGEIEQAIRLLQVQSRLADRVDDGTSVIVQNLVSVGLQASCMDGVQRVIERRDGPNLYWALRQYPVPFANFPRSVEAERGLFAGIFPALGKARNGDAITVEDWHQLVHQLRVTSGMIDDGKIPTDADLAGGLADIAENLAFTSQAMLSLPEARAYYARTRHQDPKQVEKIEPLRVVAIYQFETYQQMSDELYKWFALPYPQLLAGVQAAQAKINQATAPGQPMAMFRILAPSLARVAQTNGRVDRSIAAFACVEAIRAYAATHDGKLPPTLDAITDTPGPINPVDGQPFDYELKADGSATLSDRGELIEFPMRYDIRIRK